MGKPKVVSRRAAKKLASREMADLTHDTPKPSTFRGKQRAAILAGLHAIKAPAVS